MSIGRTIGVLAITVFFAVMWGLLLRDNLGQASSPSVPLDYEGLLKPGQKHRKYLWGVYYGKTRVGQTVSTVHRRKSVIVVVNRTEVDLGETVKFLTEGPEKLELEFQAQISDYSGIQSVQIECPQLDIELYGVRQQGDMKLRGHIGSQHVDRKIPMKRNAFLGQTLTPIPELSSLQSVGKGKTWTVELFNPIGGNFQNVNVEYRGRSKQSFGGRVVEVHQIEFRTRAQTWMSYVNGEGEILRQGTPYGLTLVRENTRDQPPNERIE